MTLLESVLVALAVALNVFLGAEIEGSNLKKINKRKMLLVVLIFMAGQALSYTLGYLVTQISFFQIPVSDNLKTMSYVLAAIILMAIGAFTLYRRHRASSLHEKLREFRYTRFILEAALIAVLTFGCGIRAGFLGFHYLNSMIATQIATILAVICGLYAGFSQGYRFLDKGYLVSCILFFATGVEILVRYLGMGMN